MNLAMLSTPAIYPSATSSSADHTAFESSINQNHENDVDSDGRTRWDVELGDMLNQGPGEEEINGRGNGDDGRREERAYPVDDQGRQIG